LQALRHVLGGGVALAGFFVHLERQQAFVHPDQHHVRPLQAFGSVQRGERHHVLVLLAFRECGQQGDGLHDFHQALAFALHLHAGFVLDLAAAAPGDPVAKVHNVGPARSGHLFIVLAVVQVFFVGDVLEPFGEESARGLMAHGVFGAVLQLVDRTTEFVQRGHGACGQGGAQRVGEQGFKQAQFVLRGKAAQRLQRGVADAALGRGGRAQKRRVVVVVDQQSKKLCPPETL